MQHVYFIVIIIIKNAFIYVTLSRGTLLGHFTQSVRYQDITYWRKQ